MEKMKECRWRRKAVFAFIFISYLLLGFSPETWAGALTYWAADGVPVITAPGDQGGPLMTLDGGTGTIMVWSDQRSGGYAIYAQRIDVNGTPLWTANGVAIYSAATVGSAWPRLVGDGAGGAIIFWADSRNGNSIYAQRINWNGQLLWNPSGVLVTGNFAVIDDAGQYRMVGDGNGGAIVCWQDRRNSSLDIYAQRIDANGNLLWGTGGVAIATVANTQQNPRMDDDSAGGAVIAWRDYRNGASNPQAFVQRVNGNGVVQWQANGILLTPSSQAYTAFPQSDNKGGAYVCWRDFRSSVTKFYVQYVNGAGNQLWPVGGVAASGPVGAVSTYTGFSDVFGQVYITWRDVTLTGSLYSTTGLYAQKVDSDGNLLWGANGVKVSDAPVKPSSSTYNIAALVNFGGGMVVVWDDYRNSNWDIYAQEVDAAGGMLWTANGMPLCTATNDQQYPALRAVNTGIIAGWRDFRNSGSSGYDIYAQRVASSERYFPHFDTTAGAWWTGGAFANANGGAANVTVTAFAPAGNQVANSPIPLAANGQTSFMVKDQLNLTGKGWLQINADKQITGLEIFGNIASGSLAGLSAARKPTDKMIFSHFDTTAAWWTGIALANPNGVPANVRISAFNQAGTQIGNDATITLPANGQTSFLVKDQLGVTGTGWIGVMSDRPIVGLEIFGNNQSGQITGVQASTLPDVDLYLAHFDTTALWWTGIALVNLGDVQATVTITAYNQAGNVIGTTTITIPALGQKVSMVKDLLGVSSTGWISVHSDQLIVGLEILSTTTSGGLAGLTAPRTLQHSLSFSHFDTTAQWWTMAALANPSAVAATVTITAYNQQGVQIGTSTITLPPNGQQFFQVKDRLGVTGTGWINVTSDQPIVGLEIFGNVASGQITGVAGLLN